MKSSDTSTSAATGGGLQRMGRAAFLLLACAAIPASAHETITTKLTWSAEISRIVYKHCASCHQEGGSSFSLIRYEEARPWAKAIKEEVLERRMPPWGAVKGFGEFNPDLGLTQQDLHLIADWVEGGAPEGDPRYLPEKPALKAPPKSKQIQGRTVSGATTLAGPATLTAIRPEGLVDGASLKAVAILPDGQIQPLIWLYGYKPKWGRNYTLRTPLQLPAGTTIQLFPKGPGKLVLLLRNTG